MYLSNLVRFSGIIENPLRNGRLSRIDMSDDAYIPDFR